MRDLFFGHIRPSNGQLRKIWNNCVFCVDANVLLNLYRYSDSTRDELKSKLESIRTRLFLPHQAASEYFSNRLSVTSQQISEYPKSIEALEKPLSLLKQKNRHPFIPEKDFKKLEKNILDTISTLSKKQTELENKMFNDDVLNFLLELFSECTGKPYSESELDKIFVEGTKRYERETPPGYADGNKDRDGDHSRKFGDLIVWKQILDFAEDQKKSIIFITDDRKEDWWLRKSGKTFGPRPELIEEFRSTTGKEFWMYTVDRFIETASLYSKVDVDPAIIEEIKVVSSTIRANRKDGIQPATLLTQEILSKSSDAELGEISIHITRPIPVATSSMRPVEGGITLDENTLIDLTYVSAPIPESEFKLTTGLGYNNCLNIHISSSAMSTDLPEGEYIFRYELSKV